MLLGDTYIAAEVKEEHKGSLKQQRKMGVDSIKIKS